MEVYNLIDEVLLEIKRDETYPKFQWKVLNDQYHVEIVSESVKLFFSLVENSKSLEKNEELEQDNYEGLLQNFISDVIMSSLYESVINVANYFIKEEKNKKEYPELYEVIFFKDFKSFKDHLEKFISLLIYKENKDSIKNVTYQYSDIINLNVPKILFPWYMYAISCADKKDKHINTINHTKMNIIIEDNVKLKSTKSENPIEKEVFLNAQKDFKDYLTLLKKYNLDEKCKINKSLNLFAFNNMTNLVDLNRAIEMFVDDSIYISKEGYKKSAINNEDRKYHKEERNYIFGKIAKIAKINSLGVKYLLIDDLYYNETLFLNELFWEIFNQLFEEMKDALLIFMQVESGKYFMDVPEAIRTDMAFYESFSNKELFNNVLEEYYNKELKVYENYLDETSIDNALMDAYGYAYKSFYKSKNSLEKNVKGVPISKRRLMLTDLYEGYNQSHSLLESDESDQF